jgi:hypothetical protein
MYVAKGSPPPEPPGHIAALIRSLEGSGFRTVYWMRSLNRLATSSRCLSARLSESVWSATVASGAPSSQRMGGRNTRTGGSCGSGFHRPKRADHIPFAGLETRPEVPGLVRGESEGGKSMEGLLPSLPFDEPPPVRLCISQIGGDRCQLDPPADSPTLRHPARKSASHAARGVAPGERRATQQTHAHRR